MAVRIRMRRIGKNPKKRPHFRITVFNETRGRDSSFIEELGYYDPVKKGAKIKTERFDFWVKKGAKPTESVARLVKRYLKEAKNAANSTVS
jgi:small subunit ribosomal protein S16